eukprot:scaffold275008_cov32-Tisochrysis_lutea.AAC.1
MVDYYPKHTYTRVSQHFLGGHSETNPRSKNSARIRSVAPQENLDRYAPVQREESCRHMAPQINTSGVRTGAP